MLIVAGLGNPGSRHARQRHNIGFMAAETIARRHDLAGWSSRFGGTVAGGRIGGEKVFILKPQTFMNRSGEAVGQAMRFHKLAAADLIVIHDELDLAPGKVRLKAGGGHGGHNGLRSIDAHCGSGYRRLRLGIGHPGSKARVNGHVLGDFSAADHGWLDPLLDALADHFALLVEGDGNGFLNRLALAAGVPPVSPGPAGAAPSRPLRPGPMAAMLKRLFRNPGTG